MGLEELDVNQDAARHQPRCGWDRLGRVTVASGGVDHNVGHGHGSQRLEELMSWVGRVVRISVWVTTQSNRRMEPNWVENANPNQTKVNSVRIYKSDRIGLKFRVQLLVWVKYVAVTKFSSTNQIFTN